MIPQSCLFRLRFLSLLFLYQKIPLHPPLSKGEQAPVVSGNPSLFLFTFHFSHILGMTGKRDLGLPESLLFSTADLFTINLTLSNK